MYEATSEAPGYRFSRLLIKELMVARFGLVAKAPVNDAAYAATKGGVANMTRALSSAAIDLL